MAYTLEAILTHPKTLQPAPSWLWGANIVSLRQGISLIPVEDEWRDDYFPASKEIPYPESDFRSLTASLEYELRNHSYQGLIAYVEAEFFGGIGDQRAIAWENGNVVYGPVSVEDIGPISQALRLLGVQKQGFHDEFDAVGLQAYRYTEEWAEIQGNKAK